MSEKGKMYLIPMALCLVFALSVGAAPYVPGAEEVSMETVAKKVSPSVVKVETRNGLHRVATGVVIDKDGYIVTTALISPRDEEIVVTTSDGRRSEAKFLGLDLETHLALLQAKEKNLTPIAMAKAGELSPGAWVGVISLSPENTPAVTQGIVSSVAPDRLRLNVWVTGGASGSPVVNKDGQMVALLRGIYREDQPIVFEFRERDVVGSGYVFDRGEAPSSGMALGIPVDIVRAVSAEIREKGKVSRGWIGVSIVENEKGQVEIDNVESDSPAELAKLKEGDIILAIEGKKISGAQLFISEIRSRRPGQNVNLQVERDGKTMDIKVKLGEYPEGEARREIEARFPQLFPPMPPQPAVPAKPGEAPKAPQPPSRDVYSNLPRARGAWPWPTWEKRKFVGVYLEALNKELLDYFGVKEGAGLLVNRLTKDGPAEKAGLKVGDVIVRVDGRKVENVSDLSELVQDKKKGDKIKFEIIRDKKPMAIEVEVGEEEGPSLSRLFESFPSGDLWDSYSKNLQRQYDLSRDVYEKYTTQQRDKLKKMNDQLAEQSKKYSDLAKQYAEKSKYSTEKYLKALKGKSRIYYRV
jgi:S1-C subfamily serine protease